MLDDIRYALRGMRANPGFTLIAVATLALGIGVNSAMFSIVNGVLLKPLGLPDGERVVALNTVSLKTGRLTPRLTGGDLVDLRDRSGIFDSFSTAGGGEIGVKTGDRAEFTGVTFTQAAYFRVMGVTPAAGRFFTDDESERAVVVSAGFARRHFGTEQAAVGQSIRIDQRDYRIAGVIAPPFVYPARTEVWAAAPVTPSNLNRSAYNYAAVARIKTGISLDEANSRADALARTLPESDGKSFALRPLRDQITGPARSTLLFLMGAVSLVLLIACANLANLLLARAASRSREIAVRTALGATRARIVRQLLVESAVLAMAGGTVGLLLAQFAADAFQNVAPLALPRAADTSVDWTMLAFTAAVSFAASILFGLAPAWHASRIDLHDALKSGGARGIVAGGAGWWRNALVAGEIALCVVLAAGAALLGRSFAALHSVDLGYRAQGVMVMQTHAPATTREDHLNASRRITGAFAEIAAIPGVSQVAAAMGLPAGRYGSNGAYAVEGRHTFDEGQTLPQAGFRMATPGYFSAMGIPIRRGRDFAATDRFESPFVAIVSESLARETFPNEDPIGKRVQCGLDSPNYMTIVGVVGDVRQNSPADKPGPELYMPVDQHPFFANELQVVVRTSVPPESLTRPVEAAMRRAGPGIATRLTTLETMVSDSVSASRLRTWLAGAFALLAIVLSMAGVYGVMSYSVAQRTGEMGVRVALGATPGDVTRLILGKALWLTLAGLAAGAALSFAAARFVESLLFEVAATDLATHGAVWLAVGLTAIAAAAIPAWRASRVDPLVALREE